MEFNKEIFKCLKCKNYPDKPIESLCCGKIYCRTCSDKNKFLNCELCGLVLKFRESIFARELMSKTEESCRHCNVKYSILKSKDHYFDCKEGNFNCTVKNCIFEGKRHDLINHIKKEHYKEILIIMENYSEVKSEIEIYSNSTMLKNIKPKISEINDEEVNLYKQKLNIGKNNVKRQIESVRCSKPLQDYKLSLLESEGLRINKMKKLFNPLTNKIKFEKIADKNQNISLSPGYSFKDDDDISYEMNDNLYRPYMDVYKDLNNKNNDEILKLKLNRQNKLDNLKLENDSYSNSICEYDRRYTRTFDSDNSNNSISIEKVENDNQLNQIEFFETFNERKKMMKDYNDGLKRMKDTQEPLNNSNSIDIFKKLKSYKETPLSLPIKYKEKEDNFDFDIYDEPIIVYDNLNVKDDEKLKKVSEKKSTVIPNNLKQQNKVSDKSDFNTFEFDEKLNNINSLINKFELISKSENNHIINSNTNTTLKNNQKKKSIENFDNFDLKEIENSHSLQTKKFENGLVNFPINPDNNIYDLIEDIKIIKNVNDDNQNESSKNVQLKKNKNLKVGKIIEEEVKEKEENDQISKDLPWTF